MGKDWIFALHPLFMSGSFVLCFSYGIISYRIETLEFKLDATSVMKPINSLRSNHRNWQVWMPAIIDLINFHNSVFFRKAGWQRSRSRRPRRYRCQQGHQG